MKNMAVTFGATKRDSSDRDPLLYNTDGSVKVHYVDGVAIADSNPTYERSNEARAIEYGVNYHMSAEVARVFNALEMGNWLDRGKTTAYKDISKEDQKIGDKIAAYATKYEEYRLALYDILTGKVSEAKDFKELNGMLSRVYFFKGMGDVFSRDPKRAYGSERVAVQNEFNLVRKALGKKISEIKTSGRWDWRNDSDAYSVLYMFFNGDGAHENNLSKLIRELNTDRYGKANAARPEVGYFYKLYLDEVANSVKVSQAASTAMAQRSAQAAPTSTIGLTAQDITESLKKSFARLGSASGFDGLHAVSGTTEGSILAHAAVVLSSQANLDMYSAVLQRATTEAKGMDLRLRDGMTANELSVFNTLYWEEYLKAVSSNSLNSFKQAGDKHAFQIDFLRSQIAKDMALVDTWAQSSSVPLTYFERMRKYAFESAPADMADINAYFIRKFGLHLGGVQQQTMQSTAPQTTSAAVPPSIAASMGAA